MSMHCPQCTLAMEYCICRHVQPQQSTAQIAQIALLLHENEPQRRTNTAPVIEQTLPATQRFIWQRKSPPQKLIRMLEDPAYQPWLIFPADRPELIERQRHWQPASDKTPLFILPDGTWKEVRKMVRQSRWLDHIPLLAFTPDSTTRYKLRRNPDADHLCTAEVASCLLQLIGEHHAALMLDQQLDRFLAQYHQWQHHLPPANI